MRTLLFLGLVALTSTAALAETTTVFALNRSGEHFAGCPGSISITVTASGASVSLSNDVAGGWLPLMEGQFDLPRVENTGGENSFQVSMRASESGYLLVRQEITNGIWTQNLLSFPVAGSTSSRELYYHRDGDVESYRLRCQYTSQ